MKNWQIVIKSSLIESWPILIKLGQQRAMKKGYQNAKLLRCEAIEKKQNQSKSKANQEVRPIKKQSQSKNKVIKKQGYQKVRPLKSKAIEK